MRRKRKGGGGGKIKEKTLLSCSRTAVQGVTTGYHPTHLSKARDQSSDSPILQARGIVGEAGAGRVDRLQLGKAGRHRGAACEPAAAATAPRRHGRGVQQAALFLHLRTGGRDCLNGQLGLLTSLPVQVAWA